MNFLGHLLLSGDDPHVITGNFMGDAVKGRDLGAHPPGIQQGIRLHRRIDVFTDQHPLTLDGRERLRAQCGKYAGVALDLFYDHCIAITWAAHSNEPLPRYVQRMYALLEDHAHLMPQRTQTMLPHLVRGDWLGSYATLHGIGRALHGLSVRAPMAQGLNGAERVLNDHLPSFVEECNAFLRSLRMHLDASH